jgi:hypothetical protein
MPPLRLREYIQPAKPARQRAASEQNLHAKRVLEEMERGPTIVWLKSKSGACGNHITADLLTSGCSTDDRNAGGLARECSGDFRTASPGALAQ